MKNLSKAQRFGLSILSGILMGISFPYTGSLFFLSFVCFVPLLILEDYISKKNYRSGKVFIHAYVAFFFYNLIATWWIYYASAGGAAMAVWANSILMAGTFRLFHLTKKHVGSKEGYISLIIFWISFEYLHFHWELSWPWLHLGNMFSRVPILVQWYNFTGVLGGSIWIIVLNLLSFRILSPILLNGKKLIEHQIKVVLFLLLLIAPISISLIQYYSYNEKTNVENVLILQPNIDPYNTKLAHH